MESFLPDLYPAQEGLKLASARVANGFILLPDLYPAQEGLKLANEYRIRKRKKASRPISSTRRIETHKGSEFKVNDANFQTYIQHKKD